MFKFSLLLTFAAGIFLAWLFAFAMNDKEKFYDWFVSIPRSAVSGYLLTTIVFLWCIPNIRPIISADSVLHPLLIPGAIISIFLCCKFLDFLFARAFAAFCILASHYLLSSAYTYFCPVPGALLAAAVLVPGVFGIVIACRPHWMRSLLLAGFERRSIRITGTVLSLYLSFASLVMFFAIVAKKAA